MAKFEIEGGQKLHGTIIISGAKNAALKILPASILADTPSEISNIPEISDIFTTIDILRSIGAKIEIENHTAIIETSGVKTHKPNADLIKHLRGSIVLIGPLLAKFGHAEFSQPGGCLIGARPIDDHLDVFRQMGVKISLENDKYILTGKPKAGDIVLSKLSVTATENAIMATVLSPGTTRIHVAAAEPEIADLADFLNKMGAKISGAGTHDITIEGVSRLRGTKHDIVPDRIEAGTYLMAAVATNSEIKIGPVMPDHLNIVIKKLQTAGAKIEIIEKEGQKYLQTYKHKGLKAESIDTRTYPGFPTDLQSPFVTLMTQAEGTSQIFETLFEGRFLYLEELTTMGAKAEIISQHIINITGETSLEGKEIFSRDLRGGAALVIAGLVAKGKTIINGLGFIDRGYEDMDGKLRSVGAKIRRIES